jgi:DNA-binding PadR family transcriptional regulator
MDLPISTIVDISILVINTGGLVEECWMGEEPREPDEYLPLTPAVLDIVVVALGDGELHGYGVMRDVRRRSDGQRRLAPGTL